MAAIGYLGDPQTGARRDTCKMGHDAKFCKDTFIIFIFVALN